MWRDGVRARRASAAAVAALLLTLVACGSTGSAQGNGSEDSGRGHLKIGWPF
jgi:hypothetical protein